MPTEQDIMQLAMSQWLDPAILQAAMQWWDPMAMMWGVWPMSPELPPNPELTLQDALASSPLLIHAEEMLPMLQSSSQDEVFAFIKKVIDLYLGI